MALSTLRIVRRWRELSDASQVVVMVIGALTSICLALTILLLPSPNVQVPDHTDYSKSRVDRIPQATEAEVTTFATTWLQQLGYTLRGTVDCHWRSVDLHDHKHYQCYGVYDIGKRPLILTCGSWTREVHPLRCAIETETATP